MENLILLHSYYHGCDGGMSFFIATLIAVGLFIILFALEKNFSKPYESPSSSKKISPSNIHDALQPDKTSIVIPTVEYRIVKEYVCVINAENYGYYHRANYLQPTVNAFKTKKEAEQCIRDMFEENKNDPNLGTFGEVYVVERWKREVVVKEAATNPVEIEKLDYKLKLEDEKLHTISTRTFRFLKKMDINFVEQLSNITERSLTIQKNFGAKMLSEIKGMMKKHGVKFEELIEQAPKTPK